MRAKWCILVLGVCIGSATVASAEEIIYFTSGGYMKIYSHELQGDMVKVRLDGEASMAFPSKLVEKIENSSGIVYGGPTNPVYPNQIVPRAPGAEPPYPVGPACVGVGSMQAREEDPDTLARRAAAAKIQTGGAMNGRAAEGQFLDGRIGMPVGGAPDGTMRVGNHLVTPSPGARLPFQPAKFAMKPGAGQSVGPLGQPPPQQYPPPPQNPPQGSTDPNAENPPNQ